MNKIEFLDFMEEKFHRLRALSETKGVEYANSDTDQFANFNRLGDKLGMDPMLVLSVYLTKHEDSIDTFMKDRGRGRSRNYAEPIEERVIDSILYRFLLLAMLHEERQKAKPVVGM